MPAIRHVVLFQFKPEADADAVGSVTRAFTELRHKIDTIQEFEWGTNVSPEGKADGFTHCFSMRFADAAARDAYLPHPDHAAFSTLARQHVARVLVVDYEVEGAPSTRN